MNRKKGEKLKIGDTMITILSNQRVKLGIEAPPEVKVERLNASSLSRESSDCEGAASPDGRTVLDVVG